MGLWGRPACRETWWCCGCWELCLASPRPPSDTFVFDLALAGLGPPSLSPSGHLSPPWTSAGPKCPLQDGPEGHCPPRLRQRPPHPRRMVAVAAGPGTRLSLSWPCMATLAVWMVAVPVTVPTTVLGPRVRCGAPVCPLHCHGRYWPGGAGFRGPRVPWLPPAAAVAGQRQSGRGVAHCVPTLEASFFLCRFPNHLDALMECW